MTESKAQLRAEAVERLNHSWNACIRDTRQLFGSLVGGGAPTYAERNDYDALIDLLTDDCGPCYSCAKLAELRAENNALLVKVVDLCEECDQWREAAGNAHEMWEQADNERIKLVEQLEACRSALEILTLDKAKLQTKIDKLTADVSQAVEDTAERVTNKCEMLHDSREKLEADVRNAVKASGFGFGTVRSADRIIGWLDRQAAITERECLERAAKSDWLGQHLHAVMAENRELQAKVDELIAEIDALEYQCDLDELEGGRR